MGTDKKNIKRAIRFLQAQGPLTCGRLGWLLWGDTTSCPGRGEGSHRENKFCRPAGKIIKRMERQGMVHMVWDDHRILWRLKRRCYV